jgi:transposase
VTVTVKPQRSRRVKARHVAQVRARCLSSGLWWVAQPASRLPALIATSAYENSAHLDSPPTASILCGALHLLPFAGCQEMVPISTAEDAPVFP